MAGRNVPVSIGNFTGCPFQCVFGTFGPGGETVVLRALPNASSCAVGCKDCPAGAVCNALALPAPNDCEAGHYNPDTGSQTKGSCRSCERYDLRPAFSLPPLPTPLCACVRRSGSFQTETAATACEACFPGSFSADKGSTACSLCRAGGYCEEAGASSASVFELCGPGTWSDVVGLNSSAGCHPCAAGFYQPLNGANNSDSCLPCPLGTANNAFGASVCPACPGGSFQDEPGQQVCKPCEPGSYCPDGAGAPLPCEEGTYSNATNLTSADECTDADPGHYATTGSTEPTPCSPGTAAPNAGMGACDACEPGKYQNEPGQLSCSVCGSGSYSANVLSCELCQVGEYCPEGATVGTPCPVGSTTEGRGAKSSDDCGCRVETYDEDPSDGIICKPCSAEMLCTRHGLTLATVPLLPSRWRHSNRTADIHACDSASNTSACLGGDVSGADGSGYCADGHEGPRCEWCSDARLYYDRLSASCKDCGDVGLYAFQQVVVLLAIVVVLALLRLALVRMPRLLARTSSRLAQLAVAAQQFGLQAK